MRQALDRPEQGPVRPLGHFQIRRVFVGALTCLGAGGKGAGFESGSEHCLPRWPLPLALELLNCFWNRFGEIGGLAFGYVCRNGLGDMLDAVVLEIEQRAVVLARKLRLEALDFGLGCFQFLSQRWFALDRRAVDGDLAALGFAPLGDVFAFEPRVDAAAVRELLAQNAAGSVVSR